MKSNQSKKKPAIIVENVNVEEQTSFLKKEKKWEKKIKKLDSIEVVPMSVIKGLTKKYDGTSNVGVFWEGDSPVYKMRAENIARQLGLDIVNNIEDKDFILNLKNEEIELKTNLKIYEYEDYKNPPISVNFLDIYNRLHKRRSHPGRKRDSPMIRAVKTGIDENNNHVLDATGGLGNDAFQFAELGMDVTVLERDPIMYTLLQDGMHRGLQVPTLRPILLKMNIIHTSAEEYFEKISKNEVSKPAVIYLDPAYPKKNKRYIKELKSLLRIVRRLVGPSPSIEDLKEKARYCAQNKVVLKIPEKLNYSDPTIQTFTGPGHHFKIFEPIQRE